MAGWSKLIDMEMDDEEKLDAVCPMPIAARASYPYGLRICLTHKELTKLGLDADCNIGDMIDLRCFGTVTSISKDDHGDGPSCRIEIQIEKMAVEDELDESEE